MNAVDSADNCWYTNYWVWLVIAIPALTVVGCMLTIWLAISNPEIIVKDPQPERVSAARTLHDALP